MGGTGTVQFIVIALRKAAFKFPVLAAWLCKTALRLVYPKSPRLVQFSIDVLGAQATRQVLGFPKNNKIKHLLDCFDPDCIIQPVRPLRIAICLSGETRTFSHCTASQQRFFSGHEVDYFCHVWTDDKTPDSLKVLKNPYLKFEARPDLSELEAHMIKKIGLIVGRNFRKYPINLNVLPMWYSVKQAYKSIEESGKNPKDYDLICRSRYDVFLAGHLSQLEQMPEPDQIVIDYSYNTRGFGDQWALGRPDEMSKYCHLFDWFGAGIERHIKSRYGFPETITRFYILNICKMAVLQKNLGLRLLRDDFIGLLPHKIPLRHSVFSKQRNLQIRNYIKQKHSDIPGVENL